MTASAPAWRPADARADITSMLRVDQAGEYGATRIYAGQLAVLGEHHPMSGEIGRMAAQEKDHLRHFDALLAERGVRPTLLQPFWAVAGHALGAATALMGPKAAIIRSSWPRWATASRSSRRASRVSRPTNASIATSRWPRARSPLRHIPYCIPRSAPAVV